MKNCFDNNYFLKLFMRYKMTLKIQKSWWGSRLHPKTCAWNYTINDIDVLAYNLGTKMILIYLTDCYIFKLTHNCDYKSFNSKEEKLILQDNIKNKDLSSYVRMITQTDNFIIFIRDNELLVIDKTTFADNKTFKTENQYFQN